MQSCLVKYIIFAALLFVESVMINRVLIRTKVLQMVYACHQNNNNENPAKAEKELFFSLEKTYDLYLYLLLLVSDIGYYAERRIDKLEVIKHDIVRYVHRPGDFNEIAEAQVSEDIAQAGRSG